MSDLDAGLILLDIQAILEHGGLASRPDILRTQNVHTPQEESRLGTYMGARKHTYMSR